MSRKEKLQKGECPLSGFNSKYRSHFFLVQRPLTGKY